MICFGIKISLSKFKCCNISISPTFMIRQSLKHKENSIPRKYFMSLYSRRMLINIQQCICYQSIYSRFSVQGICCSNIDLEPESMEIIMLKENFINHISCQQNILELTSLTNVMCISFKKWNHMVGDFGQSQTL